MAIPKMTDDLNIIQALSDLPNTEDGLTADDLKAKFDAAGLAIQNFINNTLIPAVVAAKIPFAPTNEINAETIQRAIENVQAQVKDAASGTIVNGSITKEKIASALLERIYGGRVWVSADTPNDEYNTANDFPVGQVWLRPRFAVVNDAGDSWNGSGCTAAVSGKDVTITGSAQVASVTATQNLSGIGEQGDRVFILFSVADKDSEITSLGAAVNGADAVAIAGDMVLESTLSVGGTLTVQFGIQWPSTSLAKGSVTMKSYTVVNVDKIMRQMTGATEIKHWNEYLWAKAPFTSFVSPEALFVQVADGNWWEIACDVLPVERGGTGISALAPGQMLYAGNDGTFEILQAPGDEDTVISFANGKPEWIKAAELAARAGFLRVKQGSYTGNGEVRTIELGITPKLFWMIGGTTAGTAWLDGYSNSSYYPVDLPGTSDDHNYTAGITLNGDTLNTWHNATQTDVDRHGAGAIHYNAPGTVYNWMALY